MYSLNEEYFKVIDNEEKAYTLGLFYTDGTVGIDEYQCSIGLWDIDKYMLEKIKNNMEYEGPLLFSDLEKYRIEARERGTQGPRDQWKLQISRKSFIQHLMNVGCHPQKTYVIQFPTEQQVPPGLYRHFIRGVFDGDGHIHQGEKAFTVRAAITSASKGFLESIKAITDKMKISSSICKKPHCDNYVLSYSGNNTSFKFLHWIFDDATIFLERKMDKFILTENIVNENVKRHPHRRAVLQLDKNLNIIKEHESAVHAERELDIRYQNIRVCCNIPRKTAGGFYWRWKE